MYEWLRNQVRVLPASVWVILLSALTARDIVILRASEVPWAPYVFGLALFALAWIVITHLLKWPGPYPGPQVLPVIRWPKEQAGLEEIKGQRLLMKLVKHPYRREMLLSIEGYMPGPNGWDRFYGLKVDQATASSIGEEGPLLFHPDNVFFEKRRDLQRFRRKYHKGFIFRPSIEELLLNPETLFKLIKGRVCKVKDLDLLSNPSLQWSDVRLIAFGKVYPLRPYEARLTKLDRARDLFNLFRSF